MKKYVISKLDDQHYLAGCLICIEEYSIEVLLTNNPKDIFYFDSLDKAIALVNYIQAVVEDPSVGLLVAAEVDLPDEEVTDDA